MHRMIVLTVAGGLLAAYFAYPYGWWAAALAYLVGGAFFAGLGILSYIGPWASDEDDDAVAGDAERVEPAPPPDSSQRKPSEFSKNADTIAS